MLETAISTRILASSLRLPAKAINSVLLKMFYPDCNFKNKCPFYIPV